MPFRDLINLALNETLSRTILTVSTVALAVLSLLFLGGEVLRGFSIAMLWGVVIGTYSSLFIAAPLLYYVQPNRAAIARSGEAAQGRRPWDLVIAQAIAMELTPLVPADRQVIERYGASGFRVAGVIYRGSVLVFPDRTLPWAATSAASVTWESLAPVLEHGGVQILLLGLGRAPGNDARRPADALCATPVSSLEPMDTGAACRTYNVLVAEDRRVAAALLPPI